MTAHLDTRVKIEKEAANLFNKKGFAATSMSDIAEAVGITKASLYHFFKNKESLYLSLIGQVISEAQLILGRGRSEGIDHVDHLKQLLHDLMELASSKERLMRQPEMALMGTSPGECLLLVGEVSKLEKLMTEHLVVIGHENPSLGTQIVFHSLFGYLKRRQFDKDSPPPNEFADYLISLFLPRENIN